MSGLLIGTLILWLIIAFIVIVVFVYVVNWLYHRSSKEVAFVRTGFGGERVALACDHMDGHPHRARAERDADPRCHVFEAALVQGLRELAKRRRAATLARRGV